MRKGMNLVAPYCYQTGKAQPFIGWWHQSKRADQKTSGQPFCVYFK